MEEEFDFGLKSFYRSRDVEVNIICHTEVLSLPLNWYVFDAIGSSALHTEKKNL